MKNGGIKRASFVPSSRSEREAAIWDLSERNLHERHQLMKQQLKDQYFLQRHQLLKKHDKVNPDASSGEILLLRRTCSTHV